MALHRSLLKCFEKDAFILAVGTVVAVHAMSDVVRGGGHGQAAGFPTALATPDTVGDQSEIRQALARDGQLLRVGQTRVVDVEMLPQRPQEEVVLIGLPHLSRMRQAVRIDLIIEWPAAV
jgi:hypothetical protein